MLLAKNILLFFLTVKICLDFIVPYRDINFVIINLMCVFFILIDFKKSFELTSSEWRCIIAYSTLCFLWMLVGEDKIFFIKYFSLIMIFLMVRSLVLKLRFSDLKYVCKSFIIVFNLFFLINFAISFVYYSPANRLFYNFEHVNLLGSYLLTSLTFVYFLSSLNVKVNSSKVAVIAFSFLTTSTGAFISSLLVLVNTRSIRFSKIFYILFITFVFSFVFYHLISFFMPGLFVKIFGPIQLIFNGGLEHLSTLATYRLPIQELGEEYQSSLLWRFYAYLIFFDFYLSQSFLNMFFGSGFWGFSKAWNGIAPHNDFIVFLIDFGFIGFLLFFWFFIKSFIWSIKNNALWIPLYIILFLRLSFENNVYSYYLLSTIVANITFLYYARKRVSVIS